jgi:hypothetical protein
LTDNILIPSLHIRNVRIVLSRIVLTYKSKVSVIHHWYGCFVF